MYCIAIRHDLVHTGKNPLINIIHTAPLYICKCCLVYSSHTLVIDLHSNCKELLYECLFILEGTLTRKFLHHEQKRTYL